MTETNKVASRLREAECPKCGARFVFRRARAAHFDREGFESYKLACRSCGAFLAGVIDPFDGTLLLSGAARSDQPG
jgi:hypothetical protein